MRSVNRPVTAPGLWLNEVSSVLKRSVPGPAASANRRITGSRSSWAQRQFLTGVAAMLLAVARPGTRRSISLPARVSVQTISPVPPSASPASLTAPSMPHCRKIAIVRVLIPRAFGVSAVPGWRSTSSERTPCRESSNEAASPTGPPPEMRTGMSSISSPCLNSTLRELAKIHRLAVRLLAIGVDRDQRRKFAGGEEQEGPRDGIGGRFRRNHVVASRDQRQTNRSQNLAYSVGGLRQSNRAGAERDRKHFDNIRRHVGERAAVKRRAKDHQQCKHRPAGDELAIESENRQHDQDGDERAEQCGTAAPEIERQKRKQHTAEDGGDADIDEVLRGLVRRDLQQLGQDGGAPQLQAVGAGRYPGPDHDDPPESLLVLEQLRERCRLGGR